MATKSSILLFDFLATGDDDDPADGIGAGAGGITGSDGAGADGSGAGGVCVGGCGLVCGSIRLSFSLIYNFIVTQANHNIYSILYNC